MKINTQDGIAEGLPLSDIQQNTRWLKRIFYLGIIGFIILAFLIWYAKYHNLVSYPLNIMNGVIEACSR